MRRGRPRRAEEVAERAGVVSAATAPRSSLPGTSGTGRSPEEHTGLLAGRSSHCRWLVSVASSFSRRPPLNDQPAFWRAGLHQTTPFKDETPAICGCSQNGKKTCKISIFLETLPVAATLVENSPQARPRGRPHACWPRPRSHLRARRRHPHPPDARRSSSAGGRPRAARSRPERGSPVAAIRHPRVTSRPS